MRLVQESGGANWRRGCKAWRMRAGQRRGRAVVLNVASRQEALPRVIGRAAELGLNVRTGSCASPT